MPQVKSCKALYTAIKYCGEEEKKSLIFTITIRPELPAFSSPGSKNCRLYDGYSTYKNKPHDYKK